MPAHASGRASASLLATLLQAPRRIGGFVIEAADLIGDACRAHHRHEELRHMSTARLADLGITREQVPQRLFKEMFNEKH